jgi:hypothetical protein
MIVILLWVVIIIVIIVMMEAGLRSSVHFRTDLYVPYPACWVDHYPRTVIVERTQIQ